MATDRRLVFNFDEASHQMLSELQELHGLPTMAATVNLALMVLKSLKVQADEGFTQVLVRNPKTHDERIADIQATTTRLRVTATKEKP